ncbi:MAG: hypothetical protein K2H87_08465 [Duncaniella sp.]|nr:hypothetical protein [Duncaniella sp.]
MVDYICGQPNGEKEPYVFDIHQWNLRFPSRHHIVADMKAKLQCIDREDFNDFEQLIDYVAERRQPHFGDTAIYDFALRYGWNRDPRRVPERFVYVHSKPLRAALRLKELGYLNEVARKLPLTSYAEALPGLAAMDVEHFLCLFHDEIMKLKPINN